MKILFVRPPVPKHTIGLKHIMICEPLELLYVAAAIEGHELNVFDFLVEDGFEERFKTFDPDVMVSSAYKAGTNEVLKLFRKAKGWKESCITIAGGVHATLIPEDYAYECTDIIGIGDGTMLLPEIIEALDTGQPLKEISGLAIPIGEKQVLKTADRKYMPKPDSLPLPRRDLVQHLLPKYYYLMHQPVATMKTTWGCWYKCNFCFTWKITSGVPYSRSPESIVKELESIECEDVYIVDDIFLINKSRLRKLADLIKAKNIKKKYLIYARADFIAENEEIVKEWAELGLTAVFIGLDGTTDEELEGMNKQAVASDNSKAVQMLKKYQIDTYGSLIPGANYEKKDWDRLWKFIKDEGLYYVNISPDTPLPGSDTWHEGSKTLTVPEDAHGLFDLSHMVKETKMPIKAYYRELLKLYGKTLLNVIRAKNETQRTLPSIWSWKYVRLMWGSFKIGKQFWEAHTHHTPKEIAIATDKGPAVPWVTYDDKFSHPSFRSFKEVEVEVTEPFYSKAV